MGEMSLRRSMGRKLSNKTYSHGSLKFPSSFNYKNSRFLEFEIKRNLTNVYSPRTFILVRKVPRLSSKSTEISGKMEGENTMEKRLRVFPAHSRILFWGSEVI